MDESAQELETLVMVPIGKIEDVAKKEFREARRQSSRPRNNEDKGMYH